MIEFYTELNDFSLLALLLVSHHLELIHLLQLGDLEGSMGLAGLHLKIVDLHVPLLDLVLFIELLSEHGAGLVVQLHTEGREVIWTGGRSVISAQLCIYLPLLVLIRLSWHT